MDDSNYTVRGEDEVLESGVHEIEHQLQRNCLHFSSLLYATDRNLTKIVDQVERINVI